MHAILRSAATNFGGCLSLVFGQCFRLGFLFFLPKISQDNFSWVLDSDGQTLVSFVKLEFLSI